MTENKNAAVFNIDSVMLSDLPTTASFPGNLSLLFTVSRLCVIAKAG